MKDDILKRELEALGRRLVKQAMGEPDDCKRPMPENAIEIFKIVGAWEVGSRKVKRPPDEEGGENTFGAIKDRITLAHKGGNA